VPAAAVGGRAVRAPATTVWQPDGKYRSIDYIQFFFAGKILLGKYADMYETARMEPIRPRGRLMAYCAPDTASENGHRPQATG
jgi:hypothetical protein